MPKLFKRDYYAQGRREAFRRRRMRRLGRAVGSRAHWRVRAVLWSFAVLAGLAVVLFSELADLSLNTFFLLYQNFPWLCLLLTPLIAVVTVWLTRHFFPGSEGSGIPQVIAATRISGSNKPVGALISLRIVFGKIFCGSLALLGGMSAGREGPSVQVASSIMHAAHRFLPHSRVIRKSDLVLAGGAAGIAAAFNTPLAGIVFAIEELGRRLETRTSGVLISTIIVSGIVAIALLGNYNHFGRVIVTGVHLNIVMPVIVIGLFCGLLGGLFSRILLWPMRQPQHLIWRWRRQYPLYFAAGCGLLIAIIGLMVQGASFGSGYIISQQLISGQTDLPWYAVLARYVATLLTYFSGIPGGIFAPSLAVGAGVGGQLAPLFDPALGSNPFFILGMAAFLAAVTQSPITAAVIVMEMVDNHSMVVSLMAVSLIAKMVSARLGPELYQQLALGFMPPYQEQQGTGLAKKDEQNGVQGKTKGKGKADEELS